MLCSDAAIVVKYLATTGHVANALLNNLSDLKHNKAPFLIFEFKFNSCNVLYTYFNYLSILLVKNVIINKKGVKDMNIGEKIRNAREDMDLSQRDMANLIPMNQSNYSKIERNVQEPNLEQLRRICQILNLDPRYLLNLGDYSAITEEDIKLLKDIKTFIKEHKA